jgi:hypothetical protein
MTPSLDGARARRKIHKKNGLEGRNVMSWKCGLAVALPLAFIVDAEAQSWPVRRSR